MFLFKKSCLVNIAFICLICVLALSIIGSVSANEMEVANDINTSCNDFSSDISLANSIDNSNDFDFIGGAENINGLNANLNDNSSLSISSDSYGLDKNHNDMSDINKSDKAYLNDFAVLNKYDKNNLKNLTENIFYVSTNGNDSNSGLSKENAYLTLSKALGSINLQENALTKIYLSGGVYCEENIYYSFGNVSIIGEGINKTFLDGESSHRIANIYNSSIRFINLTFINGFNSLCGGAIYNEGNLDLVNCSFSENKAFSGDSRNHAPYAYGGAVYNKGNLFIEGSVFENNSLGGLYIDLVCGGAVYNEGLLSVNDSIFRNNKITSFMTWGTSSSDNFDSFQRGGSIYSVSDNLIVSNSIFEGHHLDGLVLYPYGSTVLNYHAYTRGAAIYFEGNSCRFINCDFINNSADEGAGIWYNGNDTVLDSCSFKRNSAVRGSAIMIVDYIVTPYKNLTNKFSNLTISNSFFENNHVINSSLATISFSDSYGGTAFLKIDDIYVFNSSFENNGLLEGYKSYYYNTSNNFAHSGALFLCGQDSIVENSSFVSNKAEMGGAIYNYGFDTKILGSSFSNNSAFLLDGGAIFHSIGDLLVDDCRFDYNYAFRNGGTIHASYDFSSSSLFSQKSVFNNSVFTNSNASYGGAIFDTGNSIVFENISFINNTANYGGAIYKQGFSNSFNNLTFINNSAFGRDYSNGGAIYNYGSNLIVDSCIFADNSADLEGGAIFNFGESCLVSNSIFDGNDAFKGGSVYLSGKDGRFQQNNLSSSFAVYGGGLYNANSNLICLNNSFNNCSANITGGAIYNLLSTLELYANSMNNCKANLSGLGSGDYVFTLGNISYLTVSFANNASFNVVDNRSVALIANITDNMGNPITGGNFSFILFNQSADVSNGTSFNDESLGGLNDGSLTEEGHGESSIIGTSEVIEGIASMNYNLTLELGTRYVISGTYSLAAEPVSTQMGSLNSVLSTSMYFSSNIFDGKIVFGEALTYELILLDSQNNYIPNAEVLVYLDGTYSKSVFTNDVGYLNDTISGMAIQVSHLYSFIYGGDIFHNRFVHDLEFEVFYNNTYIFDDMILSFSDPVYAIVETLPGNDIDFQFVLSHKNGTALPEVSTPRYFLVYENGELVNLSNYRDYLGNVTGVDCLYYTIMINGFKTKVYKTASDGSFFMPINKMEPGLYEYDICFLGDLVKQYDSTMHNHISEADNYYNPCKISFVLIVDSEDAEIGTSLNFTSADFTTEVDYPHYEFNLTDSSNNPLDDKEIRIYDNGSYVDSAFTENGIAEFTFPHMLDLGSHLIEFVFAGDEEYLSVFKILELDVTDNPRKDNVAFFNKTPLNLTGPKNNLTVQLRDYYNNNLSNRTIDINISFNPADFDGFSFGGFDKNTYSFNEEGYAYSKNIRLVTDDNGLFSVPIELGAGNYRICCSYDGNKWYWGNNRTFEVNVNKVQTLLFGQNAMDVLKNDSYLTVVLSTNDLNVLSHSKIRYLVLSADDNIDFNLSYLANSTIRQLSDYIIGLDNYYDCYYAFTNESSISRLKISLPVGSYYLVTVYDGNKWNNGSVLFTKLSVFGEASKLETNPNTIIKKSGYYSVRLLDSSNNPLSGQTINITVDGKSYFRLTDLNGEARLEIDLDYGNYTILSQFKGNLNYSYSFVSSNLFVVDDEYKYPSSLKVNSSNIYRSEGKYQVVLTGIGNDTLSNRTLIIDVNGSNYTARTDGNGMAILDYNFTLGTYHIVSSFMGDEYYKESNVTFILTVVGGDAAGTVLNSSIYWVFKGQNNIYAVTLSDKIQNPISGETIVFSIGNQEYYNLTDTNGNAHLVIDLETGSYNVYSYFRGTDVFYSSECYSKLVVLPLENETGTDLINSSNSSSGIESGNSSSSTGINGSSAYGSNESDINGSSGAVVNGSNINFPVGPNDNNDDSSNNTNFTGNPDAVNGTANFTNGTTYGNSTTSNSNSSASKTVTKLIARNLVKYYKNSSKLVIYLKTSNNKALKGKTISIVIKGKTYRKATDKNGKIYLAINLRKGSYSVNIKFAGDNSYKASYRKVTVKVVIPSVKAVKTTVKKRKKLQILFKTYNGKVIKNQKVFIKINSRTYAVKTNSKGIASLTMKAKKGTYRIITGLKNTNAYGKYTKSFKIRVN